jgi:3'-phosphoadenosine 5'-phosphosulfate sulfotransferase (PAPS reductase)/FAD synthetase
MGQLNLFEEEKKTDPTIDLHDYDLIIINSSGGKDSLCALYEMCRLAYEQDYRTERMLVSHQDLGESEWQGTHDLAKEQAEMFGLDFVVTKRRNKDGYEETLLEYAERRGKWPSNNQRWCTSDFKRAPGSRVVTARTKDMGECKVLYVFGFRADESPARKKKEVLVLNKQLTTKKRTVMDFLPIHDWDSKKVWDTIKGNGLPYHKAYDLGMPRLSCVFCIFSPKDALVIAGRSNPELLDKYIGVEDRIGHTFRQDQSLREIRDLINEGYQPKNRS